MQSQLHKVSLFTFCGGECRVGCILTEMDCKRNECHISGNNLECMQSLIGILL